MTDMTMIYLAVYLLHIVWKLAYAILKCELGQKVHVNMGINVNFRGYVRLHRSIASPLNINLQFNQNR